jgi:two-component system, NtrC family, response regulator GlrR
VVVDCGALIGSLMESELFGHLRGAFSGATQDRTGLIEMADGGTLFLDEIGELPLGLQVKLLGTIERRRVTPLGSSQSRKVDVRLISSTQHQLLRAVNEGRFRSDLYYRIAVVRLRVPPLRQRLEDLPLIVGEILRELREREGDAVPTELSALAMGRLQSHAWPGNVRELRNTVDAAVLNLQPAIRSEPDAAVPSVQPYFTGRAFALDQFHQQYFSQLVADPEATYSEIARKTGLDRRYLHRILRRYGLKLQK